MPSPTLSALTIDPKALEIATQAFFDANNEIKQCEDCGGAGRHPDESNCAACDGGGFIAPEGWDPYASLVRAYIAAAQTTEAPTTGQHKWVRSNLGHGEQMCEYCKSTDRELAALGELDHCDKAPAAPSYAGEGVVVRDWAVKAVEDAQAVLAEYIVPDSGISEMECVNRLLGILDHQDLVRKQRSALAPAIASPPGSKPDDGWVEWGAPQKAPSPDTLVLVKVAGDGKPRLWHETPKPASMFAWGSTNSDLRIIAYRVVTSPGVTNG